MQTGISPCLVLWANGVQLTNGLFGLFKGCLQVIQHSQVIGGWERGALRAAQVSLLHLSIFFFFLPPRFLENENDSSKYVEPQQVQWG